MISILQMVPSTPQEKIVTFEGVFSTKLEDELEILVTEDENTDLILKVDTAHLLEQLKPETQDIDTIINILPIRIKCLLTTTGIVQIVSIESDDEDNI